MAEVGHYLIDESHNLMKHFLHSLCIHVNSITVWVEGFALLMVYIRLHAGTVFSVCMCV